MRQKRDITFFWIWQIFVRFCWSNVVFLGMPSLYVVTLKEIVFVLYVWCDDSHFNYLWH